MTLDEHEEVERLAESILIHGGGALLAAGREDPVDDALSLAEGFVVARRGGRERRRAQRAESLIAGRGEGGGERVVL